MKQNPWKSKPDIAEQNDKEIRMGARAMIEKGKENYRFFRSLLSQGITDYPMPYGETFSVREMADMWLSYALRGARILYTRNPTVK